jgi:hypothetical protein
LIRQAFRFDLACASIAAISVLIFSLGLSLKVARAASADSPQQSVASPERAVAKSEAAEAWDAIKDTKNPALLEAFIKRFGATFFAEIAKARLGELRTSAAKPTADGPHPPILQMPTNGIHERSVLYEEDRSDPKGRQFSGSVIWHTELIKAPGKPDELVARADIDIPSRGLRMTMSLGRNLDPSVPASHIIYLTLGVPAKFDAGGIANVPGILMKSNEQAKGVPLAALSVKDNNGSFLVGLSSVPVDVERNLKTLLERSWVDVPIVYADQSRAILAIDKGGSGEQVFRTVFTAWGQYPAAASENDGSNNSGR